MVNKKGPLAIAILWMIISAILFFTISDNTLASHNILVICCIVSYALSFFTWFSHGNRITSVYVIFMTYAFFSNLGQSLLSLFPNTDLLLMLYNNYGYAEICDMLRFQLLCISGLNLGVAIYLNSIGTGIMTTDLQIDFASKPILKNRQLFVDIILYFSFAFMIFIAIRQLILRQTLSYNQMYDQQIYGGIFRFFTISLGFLSIFRKRHIRFVVLGWLFLFLVFMITGTRSVGIPYFGAIFISVPIIYPRITEKKYSPIIMVAIFFGFSFISVISNLRHYSIGSGTSEYEWWVSFLGTIEEMGGSARPAIETISTLNEDEYMLTIPYAVLQIFTPSTLLDSIVPSSWSVALGSWINTLHSEDNAWGFSFIAEAYANFGYYGWTFMVLYGYLISRWEIQSYKNVMKGKYLYAACFLAILCRQIFFARGQLQLGIDFFRPAFYVFLFYIVFLRKSTFSKFYQ